MERNPSIRTVAKRAVHCPQVPVGDGESLDGIGRGEVLLIQRRAGYRFAVDALILSAFAGSPRGPVADLGTGCGIIALLLAARGVRSVVGVELQAGLYELAFRNVSLNRRGDQVRVVHADLRRLRGVLPQRGFELVVANPPYVPMRAGAVNPISERAIARHELTCGPPDLARAGHYLLRDGGSLKVIFPAQRLIELINAFGAAGLETRRLRMVHPVPGRPAKMVLLEAIKARKGPVEVMPPLHLYDASGNYAEEARRILGDAKPDSVERPV